MNDPLNVLDCSIEFRPVAARLRQSRRIQEEYPCSPALELDQIIIVAIAESRCTFSIRSQCTASLSKQPTGPAISDHVINDRRHTLGGL